MSSNGSCSSGTSAFSHAFAMAWGGGREMALSLTACQVVVKDKNH